MKVQFLGAAQTVTGSCYIIEACGIRFAVDCGLHQGNKAIEERNRSEQYRPEELAFIVVSHAHIDHSGLLPRMVKGGFKNPIYCTEATHDFLEIMLLDSAHIQETEARIRAEKYQRRGKPAPPPPLYTTDDAMQTLPLMRMVKYKETFTPHSDISVTFYDAGHILGSAYVYIEATEDGTTTSLLFSGDLGRTDALIVQDPEPPLQADYLFMESTYGDRNHKAAMKATDELAEAIAYSHKHGEKVIIPAFAVERTQEILYCLHQLSAEGKLPENIPIYVDSPLAIKATEVFRKHADLFDDDAKQLLAKGEDPFALPNLHFTLHADDSRSINEQKGPAIIISASGMCNAGRIRHHLRHNLMKPGASIVFVGYQAVGTPGRHIVDKAESISLFGDDIPIKANIVTIGGFSAHAGQSQLLDWVEPAITGGSQVVLMHGEEKAQTALAACIKERYDATALMPDYLEELELISGKLPVRTNNAELAYPHIDWDYLTTDIDKKLADLREKLHTLDQRPWVEQTVLKQRLESLGYELTKLISGM